MESFISFVAPIAAVVGLIVALFSIMDRQS